ncbi:MAG: nuclear transport factor 2 family protein [Melioribacteraceae bacterium]|nr:nuclear transport factor 2 family protein [Melioribacteraceae bacterium]
MKALKTTIILFTLFLFSTSLMAGNFDKAAEEAIVKKTIENYVQSMNKRNADDLKDVLYSKSNFIKLNAIVNKVTESSASDFLKSLASGRLGFWKEVAISSVEVTEQMAHATLNVATSNLKQIEYISLFKVDGTWKIVSVLSTLEKE